jgi:hypothetical protein
VCGNTPSVDCGMLHEKIREYVGNSEEQRADGGSLSGTT